MEKKRKKENQWRLERGVVPQARDKKRSFEKAKGHQEPRGDTTQHESAQSERDAREGREISSAPRGRKEGNRRFERGGRGRECSSSDKRKKKGKPRRMQETKRGGIGPEKRFWS